jgi:hypothetical protein
MTDSDNTEGTSVLVTRNRPGEGPVALGHYCTPCAASEDRIICAGCGTTLAPGRPHRR